jgi:hypothetical protein
MTTKVRKSIASRRRRLRRAPRPEAMTLVDIPDADFDDAAAAYYRATLACARQGVVADPEILRSVVAHAFESADSRRWREWRKKNRE